MHSGVPQGTVLGPILFVLYINDLVENLESGVSLFADDAKLYTEIKDPSDVETLQRDLQRVEDWSKIWLLTFNINKCKTMHIGCNNARASYMLYGVDLMETEVEKDLGILVSSNLKSSNHVAAKANARLGIIKRSFEFLVRDFSCSLFDLGETPTRICCAVLVSIFTM